MPSTLAREDHVSVRSLQEGFKRDVERPPMPLRRAHSFLQRAAPGTTTVEAVASRAGSYAWGDPPPFAVPRSG
jgi:hypothetical protein